MFPTVYAYIEKLKRQFFQTIKKEKQPSKRPLEEVSDDDDDGEDDDDESLTKNPYKPLRKKVCPQKDIALVSSQSYHTNPSWQWKFQQHYSLPSLKKNENSSIAKEIKESKIKKPIDLRDTTRWQRSLTQSLSIKSQEQDKMANTPINIHSKHNVQVVYDRKLSKKDKSSSTLEKSEIFPKNFLRSSNYSAANKKPLPPLHTKWKPTTLNESFRIEEKKQYQKLLKQCTQNQSYSLLSASHSVWPASSSSSKSRWSRSSSIVSIHSDAESENTSPTTSSDRLFKSSGLESEDIWTEESSLDPKTHSSHYQALRIKSPLAHITMRKKFNDRKTKTEENIVRNKDSCGDIQEHSFTQMVREHTTQENGNSVPVIDLINSDSESCETIQDTDSEGVEIVDEFPHGKKKSNLLGNLYNRKLMVPVQKNDDEDEKDEELELKQTPSQVLHHKVENRLKHLDIICASAAKPNLLTKSTKKSKLTPLTGEMEIEIEAALIPFPKAEVLIQKFNIKITRHDMATLSGINWLNDEVVNFYMSLIMERSINNKNLPRVYAFSTFFYPKLLYSGYKSVSRWTKKVDIFTYDILLVPIHLDVHWCMATIDFRKKCINYYDSMLGYNNVCLESLLEYLKDEHQVKKKKVYGTIDWQLENMKDIPEQMNGSDCGVFSCQFAEYKSRLASLDFTQKNMPYFRRRMVYEIIKGRLID